MSDISLILIRFLILYLLSFKGASEKYTYVRVKPMSMEYKSEVHNASYSRSGTKWRNRLCEQVKKEVIPPINKCKLES